MQKVIFVVAVVWIFSACTSLDQSLSTRDVQLMKSIPNQFQLGVDEIHQTTNYTCASVSTTMAIKYLLKSTENYDEIEQWKISGASYSDAMSFGNDMPAMIRLAKHYGVSAKYTSKLSIRYLQYHISKGNLVLVNIRPDFPENNTHAMLIVGYDKDKKEIYCCDLSNYYHVIKEDELDRIWSASLASPRGMSTRSGIIFYGNNEEKTNTDN